MKNYFSHDSNARNDEKLLRLRMKHKAAGYGVYFMLLERMREEKDYMCVKDYNTIAFDLREDAALVKSVVEDFGLFVFTEDGKYFYSESFRNRMKKKDECMEKRSQSGKKGARSRWKKKPDSNDGKQPEHPGDPADVPPASAEGNISPQELPLFPEEPADGQKEGKATPDKDPNHIDEASFIKFYNYAINYYHSKISPITRMSDNRRNLIQLILSKGYSKNDITKVICEAANAPRLNGRGDKSFIPDFTWIFTEDNFLKILEGNYRPK